MSDADDARTGPAAVKRAARPRNGGLAARLAVTRWAWRMFRREWRQQVLVMALLTATVTGALLMIAVAYNLPDSPDARFGTATQRIRLDGDDLSRRVASARDVFGTIDVIGQRSAPIPGLTRTVELRAQDPNGPYGRPMLRLVSGRYPTAAGEVAVTDELATLMRVRVGGRLALDG